MESPVVSWLQERLDNCLRIAKSKSGVDRLGWIDDAQHFHAAIETIKALEMRLFGLLAIPTHRRIK